MRIIFKKWLQALGKLEYVQGKNRPDVNCILCSIRDNDKRVESLKYYQDELIFITLNLFPYNPAHSMIVPKRHVFDFTELRKEEIIRISRAIQGLQMMLNDLYNPQGYNIGLNQGINAGGSIKHLHFHIVPRYGAELGYIDIVGKTRIVVESLESVKEKLDEKVSDYLNEEFFMNF